MITSLLQKVKYENDWRGSRVDADEQVGSH